MQKLGKAGKEPKGTVPGTHTSIGKVPVSKSHKGERSEFRSTEILFQKRRKVNHILKITVVTLNII